MTVEVSQLEVVQVSGTEDKDDICHWTCHCTEYEVSACGLNVADTKFCEDGDGHPECPLCGLRWPPSAPACPLGCSCSEECGPR